MDEGLNAAPFAFSKNLGKNFKIIALAVEEMLSRLPNANAAKGKVSKDRQRILHVKEMT